MGNSGSQNQQETANILPDEQWANSFPRSYHSQPKLPPQHKVLPEKTPALKLRPTNNGEILQSGGTIRGGRLKTTEDERFQRFLHSHEEPNPMCQKVHERDTSRFQGVQRKLNNVSNQQMKSCESEPDLRYALTKAENREKRSKKKYKAPSPPKTKIVDNYKKEDSTNLGQPIRKARLFKTRVETKNQSSHAKENEDDSNKLDCPMRNFSKVSISKRFSLPEVKLMDSNAFSRELKDVMQRFKCKDKEQQKPDADLEQMTRNKQSKSSAMPENEKNQSKVSHARGEASGKESTSPEMSPTSRPKYQINKSKVQPKPKQVFYFGMNENPRDNAIKDDIFFNTTRDVQNLSASDISSDIDSEEYDTFKSGIDLQLRPILPKKQLEIPRFSPAAAWRLLTLDTNEDGKTTPTPTLTGSGSGAGAIEGITCFGGTIITDDVPLLMEEHIEKYSRPLPPLIHAGQRSCNDKSGDSGISGDDAIPIVYCYDNEIVDDEDDRFSNIMMHENKFKNTKKLDRQRTSWTPQQDLDESSAEEDLHTAKMKMQPRIGPHVFSLSLPRESHLAAYMSEKIQYNGIRKFKKSLTNVWGNLSNKKDYFEQHVLEEKSDNWFLSKSAPNSLTNAIHSLERYKIENRYQGGPPNVNTATRLMYLPETDSIPKIDKRKIFGMNKSDNSYKSKSKSCENIMAELSKKSPEQLQDPKPNSDETNSWNNKRKPKKYTFQSTIRQIEKKRLSDKLSREAEMREKERIRELNAMQKVEEEFQRKRASEKANIRQQLRLFSLDESKGCQSLPNFEVKNKLDRTEPDGAFSSVSSSSISSGSSSSSSMKNAFLKKMTRPKIYSIDNKVMPSSTKELSEFRQVQRDYKDYNRSFMKHTSDKRYSNRQTTVHPRISCNMPQVKGMDLHGRENPKYRKDFVPGIRSASTESTHSDGSYTMQHRIRKKQTYN